MKTLLFLPKPESVTYTGQYFQTPRRWRVCIPKRLDGIRRSLESLWPGLVLNEDGYIKGSAGNISFRYQENLPEEGYRMEITKEGTVIGYGSEKGAYYAMVTLYQAVWQSKEEDMPCCIIQDKPALKLRGALWDISRGKVPKLGTLKNLADILAALKYNHLELYIEGFSYGYPSYPRTWREDSCLLPEEIQELSVYCRERFIELVPHQNSLGHMASWLARPKYRGLAEAEEGLEVMGMHFPPTTLDVNNPESFQLVKHLIEDVCPPFEAKVFHAGLDEAFEFGRGKNKSLMEKEGGKNLILPYIQALYKTLHEKDFQMMMWDDLLVKYPDISKGLTDDILILNWGYDREYPTEQRAKYLKETGKRFCLSPGTSSWSSFTGLTDNMLENVRRTAMSAHKYGAEGMLVTDWGDMNHLQYQPVSYCGLAYSAAWAWNRNGMEEEELESALNAFVFQDASQVMGGLVLKAGRFYLEEEFRLPCRSLACLPLMFGRLSSEAYEEKVKWLVNSVKFFSPPEVCRAYLESYEKRKEFNANKLYDYLEECLAELNQVSLNVLDGALIVREYQNALKMLMYLTQVREEMIDGTGNQRYSRLYQEIIEEHRALWLKRNKKSSLDEGIGMFHRIGQKGC